jgi:rRNA-processing protein FCF1
MDFDLMMLNKYQRIIIDTNALMAIVQFKVDIFEELKSCCDFKYEVAILKGSIDELNKLADKDKSKESRTAKLLLQIIKSKKLIVMLHPEGYVDDLLVDYSKRGFLVLTQDIPLKKQLTRPYLTLRQKKIVIMVK